MPGNDPRAFDLARLSRLGYRGTQIPMHRAMRRLAFRPSMLVAMLLLPTLADGVLWLAFDPLMAAWRRSFEFWFAALHLPGSFAVSALPTAVPGIRLPRVDLACAAPDGATWWGGLLLSLAALALAGFIRENWLPLRHALRILALILLVSLSFFAVAPDAFPYSCSAYLGDQLGAHLTLLAVIPWVHALVYYVFGFGAARNLALTASSLAFLCVAAPLLYVAHAYVLDRLSLLFMPPLFFCFGLLPNILACIAIYAWAMSWGSSSARRN